ncbi:hypothetical protein GBA52_008379 [Prunus armeniaca]|nr:hypothetical protein GBA52_008379 [Prunus armeniaca]
MELPRFLVFGSAIAKHAKDAEVGDLGSWKKCGCNVCTISCSWGGRGLEKRREINSRKASLHKDECSTPQGSGRVVKTSVVSFSEEWINECNFSH